jgi:ribosomal-protein-alanine N-acetyltransferase
MQRLIWTELRDTKSEEVTMTSGSRKGHGAQGAAILLPPAQFRTERLRLRAPLINDAEALFEAYGSDPRATRYLTWHTEESSEEMRAFLTDAVGAVAQGKEFFWVIEELSGAAVGMISFSNSGHGPELGYVISPRVWGRGYATEAGRALVSWLMEQHGVYRVWAFCDVDNAASRRVLQKLGLEREGVLRRWIVHPNVSEMPRDVYVFSVVK